jgi:phage tail sheath protein FI
MAYLHGVETLVIGNGPVPVQVVKSAVIGLVGIAPQGPVNVLTQVNNINDAAQFGSPLTGFNIPQALKQIFAQGAGTVLVVNVFDPTNNAYVTQVTAETHTITAGKFKLGFNPVSAVTFVDNSDVASTLVQDVDYSLDVYGNFVALKATAANGTVLKATYKKLNAGGITSSVIIGTYNTGTGARTGLQGFDVSKNLVGFLPKILIAPNYSSVSAVAAELIVKAGTYRAVALLDAPYGTTVAAAIAGRALGGGINFDTSSKRVLLLYPYLKAYDTATDSNQDFPYSSFMAGVIAATDLNDGYHFLSIEPGDCRHCRRRAQYLCRHQ